MCGEKLMLVQGASLPQRRNVSCGAGAEAQGRSCRVDGEIQCAFGQHREPYKFNRADAYEPEVVFA